MARKDLVLEAARDLKDGVTLICSLPADDVHSDRRRHRHVKSLRLNITSDASRDELYDDQIDRALQGFGNALLTLAGCTLPERAARDRPPRATDSAQAAFLVAGHHAIGCA